MSNQSQVHFEQHDLTSLAVEIDHRSCLPVIGPMHRVLFELGLDISSYRARPSKGGLVERIVLERHDGRLFDDVLSARARAAILMVA